MADKRMLVAKESFSGRLPDGSTFFGYKGRTRIWNTHPAAHLWADKFEELAVTDTYRETPEVEQATAAPGEKRGYRRG